MSKFYYFEGNVFKTKKAVIEATKNYIKKYDVIETCATWDKFQKIYDYNKAIGESDEVALIEAQNGRYYRYKIQDIDNDFIDEFETLSEAKKELKKYNNEAYEIVDVEK